MWKITCWSFCVGKKIPLLPLHSQMKANGSWLVLISQLLLITQAINLRFPLQVVRREQNSYCSKGSAPSSSYNLYLQGLGGITKANNNCFQKATLERGAQKDFLTWMTKEGFQAYTQQYLLQFFQLWAFNIPQNYKVFA